MTSNGERSKAKQFQGDEGGYRPRRRSSEDSANKQRSRKPKEGKREQKDGFEDRNGFKKTGKRGRSEDNRRGRSHDDRRGRSGYNRPQFEKQSSSSTRDTSARFHARVSPARRVAIDALTSLFEEDAFLQPVLSSLAAQAQLSPVDRRLAWELVLGISRRWGSLIAHLDELLSKGTESLPPEVLRALVLGAYQLVYLDKIPAYAAINESVSLAKECDHKYAGLVNKILKVIMENGLPEIKKLSGLNKLAAELSHPQWWVKAQLKQYGREQTKKIAEANNNPAPLAIRFAPQFDHQTVYDQLRAEGAKLTPLTWAKGGYALDVKRPFALPSHREGLWYVQDEASQLVSLLLAPKAGDRVWDVCAAPGGKSLTILEQLGPEGQLLSTDLHERKAQELAARLVAFPQATVCQHDAVKGAPNTQQQVFDKILLDAPCSALGVIRRHPEIRWRRTPKDVTKAAKKQRKLLEAVALHLKVGGTLVYSVCTDTEEESTQIIDDFLLAFPEFVIDSPTKGDQVWDQLYHDKLSLNAADHGTDGFFAVKLTRVR